jgi:hypothetical protein
MVLRCVLLLLPFFDCFLGGENVFAVYFDYHQMNKNQHHKNNVSINLKPTLSIIDISKLNRLMIRPKGVDWKKCNEFCMTEFTSCS